MTDLHCHILPGADDGAASEEESLAMAAMAERSGVRAIAVTPHCNVPGEFENYAGPELQRQLENFARRMNQSQMTRLRRLKERLDVLAGRRVMQDPSATYDDRRVTLDLLQEKLGAAMLRPLEREKQRFSKASASLDALSPLKVLGRGYALATAEDGTLLRSSDQIRKGDKIHLRLAQGGARCIVEETGKENLE